MNNLVERKRRLLAESEANREELQREWRQITETVQGGIDRLRSPGAWVALALSFWNRPAAPGTRSRNSQAGSSDAGQGGWLDQLSRAIRMATAVIGTWRRSLAKYDRGRGG